MDNRDRPRGRFRTPKCNYDYDDNSDDNNNAEEKKKKKE